MSLRMSALRRHGLLGRDIVERPERTPVAVARIGLTRIFEPRQSQSTSFACPSWLTRMFDAYSRCTSVALRSVHQRVGDLQCVAQRVGKRQRTIRTDHIAQIRPSMYSKRETDAALFADEMNRAEFDVEPSGGAARLEAAMRIDVVGRVRASTFHSNRAMKLQSWPRKTTPMPPRRQFFEPDVADLLPSSERASSLGFAP